MARKPKEAPTEAKGKKGLTIKQERFCQAYIETGNASEAYRRAYDTSRTKPESVNRLAKKMMDNVKIGSRLRELASAAIERHDITVDYLTQKLKDALAKAMDEPKGASAAVSAVVALGKLHGLIIDKKHVTGDHKHHHTSEPVSESAEWLAGVLGGKTARPSAQSRLQ